MSVVQTLLAGDDALRAFPLKKSIGGSTVFTMRITLAFFAVDTRSGDAQIVALGMPVG